MKVLVGLIIMLSFGISVQAQARLPETKAEKSLLYWRYLCRDGVQEEAVHDQIRELKCKNQNWRVRSPANEGKVLEVLEE